MLELVELFLQPSNYPQNEMESRPLKRKRIETRKNRNLIDTRVKRQRTDTRKNRKREDKRVAIPAKEKKCRVVVRRCVRYLWNDSRRLGSPFLTQPWSMPVIRSYLNKSFGNAGLDEFATSDWILPYMEIYLAQYVERLRKKAEANGGPTIGDEQAWNDEMAQLHKPRQFT